MDPETKRLFFALEVTAPWPEELPAGRRLVEGQRHMTVAFLGQCHFSTLQALLPHIPLPPFQVGLAGFFDRCLFLPERHPRVVAWHVQWLEQNEALIQYQKELVEWLQRANFHVDAHKEFLPHVTLARAPFNPHPWKKSFKKLPLLTKRLALYESVGGLRYVPIWSHDFFAPFLEVEHTADLAFEIFGENLVQLQLHALLALSFKCPELLLALEKLSPPQHLEELIFQLNQIVSHIDSKIGCSFKAVSYHGTVEREKEILKWEMIVDV